MYIVFRNINEQQKNRVTAALVKQYTAKLERDTLRKQIEALEQIVKQEQVV
jgi:hypothetical protein